MAVQVPVQVIDPLSAALLAQLGGAAVLTGPAGEVVAANAMAQAALGARVAPGTLFVYGPDIVAAERHPLPGGLLLHRISPSRLPHQAPFLSQVLQHVAHPIFVKDRELRFVFVNQALCKMVGLPEDQILGHTDYDLFPREQADFFRGHDLTTLGGTTVVVDEEPITDAAGMLHVLSTTKVPMRGSDGEVTHLVGIIHDISQLKSAEDGLRNANVELAGALHELKSSNHRLHELDRLKSELLANVSHEFRTPLTLNLAPLEELLATPQRPADASRLQLIYRNSLRLLHLVNNLLDFARLEAGRLRPTFQPVDVSELTERVCESFAAAFQRKGVAFQLHRGEGEAGETLSAYLDPQLWEKVLFNLLSNALKFTEHGQVSVTLTTLPPEAHGSATDPAQPGELLLRVRDSGPGIPEADRGAIFDRFHRVAGSSQNYEGAGIGLSLVAEAVRLHGGSIDVESEEGQGACFSVRVPLGHAHLPEALVQQQAAAPGRMTSWSLAPLPPWQEGEALPPSDLTPPFGTPLLTLPSQTPTGMLSPSQLLSPSQTPPHGSPLTYPGHTLYTTPPRGTALYITPPGGTLPPGLQPLFSTHSQGSAAQPTTRVLVVDDNPEMRSYLRHLLSGLGQVETATDGLTALERARATLPDLIVADVMMPRLDGFGLCQRIKADPATAEVPIILLTARAELPERVRGLRVGADDYVLKPFSPEELLARARLQLHLRSARRRLRAYATELERLLAERAAELRHKRAELETILTHLGEGVLVWDQDGTLVTANAAAELLSGVVAGAQPITIADWSAAVHLSRPDGQLVAAAENPVARALLGEAVHDCELRLWHGQSGHGAWVLLSAARLPDGVPGVVCTLHDVSRLKEAERLKDEFLSVASHELRTPLASLQLLLGIFRSHLRDNPQAPQLLPLLDREQRLLGRLNRLIMDILDVSRIQLGKLSVSLRPVDLLSLLRDGIERARGTVGARHEIVLSAGSPGDLLVQADPDRLDQVVSNLLANACKYAAPGTLVSVLVSRRGGYAEVEVRDAGPGIPASLHGRIFERFYQVEAAAGRAFGGLGLGLYISRELVAAQGGRIWVESQEGAGACFHFTIPLVEPSQAETKETSRW